MKSWSAILMVLMLCLGGFISTAHAGLNPDHARHDTGQTHECEAPQASSDNQQTSQADTAYCEAACHAGAMVTPVISASAEVFAEGAKIGSTNAIMLSSLSATPDQPPRIS